MIERKGIEQRPEDGMTSDPATAIFARNAPEFRSESMLPAERTFLKKGNKLISYLRSEYHLK
jgi:hypothetical protein